MQKQFRLAVLLLVAGISFAEAGQEVNSITSPGSGSATNSAAPVSASVATTDQSMFKFGGFASLGFSHSSLDSGDYVLDGTMP
jgi:hypothetical protein